MSQIILIKRYSKLLDCIGGNDVMVNTISTPCCNTVLVYILLNQINFKLLLRLGNTGCVCVVECSSYASRLIDVFGCRRNLASG